MPKVFISHSSEDREFVENEIIPLLRAHSVETWYSQDSIVPADQWERSILQGLKACDCFLLVMSPRSAHSPWVKKEVDWVFTKGGKTVVPVLMEDCDSDDFHLGLAGLQYVDFSMDRKEGQRKLLQVWTREYQGPTSPTPETEEQPRRLGGGEKAKVPGEHDVQLFLHYNERFEKLREGCPDAFHPETLSMEFTEVAAAERRRVRECLVRYLTLCSEENFLWKRGHLKSEVWSIWLKEIERLLRTPLYRSAWPDLRAEYDSDHEFLAFVEQIQASTPGS